MKNFVAQVAGIASLALAAVPALALTTAVHAQTPTVRATVQVADLNLRGAGGQTAFHQRLERAARQACAAETSLNTRDACRAGIRAEAREKLSRQMG